MYRYPGTEKKEGNSTADTTLLSKENTIGSYGSKDTLNASSNQKPLMEYHKLSNLDLPKEIIHGNSKPEHFFGFQQNLRKQGTHAQQNSPKNAQVKQVKPRKSYTILLIPEKRLLTDFFNTGVKKKNAIKLLRKEKTLITERNSIKQKSQNLSFIRMSRVTFMKKKMFNQTMRW